MVPPPLMSVSVFTTITETRDHLNILRQQHAGPVVLVPTMGALHRGHGQLVKEAREAAGKDGTVVVSIFVNPTQFGPNEDFNAYPRSMEADTKLCEEMEADVIFHPDASELYAENHSIEVVETRLSRGLCGASRVGHFPGVCLVVTKLFGAVQPDKAIFGRKDYQQLAVIRRLVRDLCLPVEIVVAETVREDDGLALSSRNQYLSRAERQTAPGIRAALLAGRDKWQTTPEITPSVLLRFVRSRLEQLSGSKLDYVELIDAETLEPIEAITHPVIIAVGIFFGKARLIDNIEFGPQTSEIS